MRQIVRLLIPLTLAGLSAAPVFAQNPSPRGPVEVSVGLGRMIPTFGDFTTEDMTEPSLDLRLTVPFTRRFAIESFGTVGQRGSEYFKRTEGLYGVQIRQRLLPHRGGSFQPF